MKYKTYKVSGAKVELQPWAESVVYKHIDKLNLTRPRVIYADVANLDGLVTQVIAYRNDERIEYYVVIAEHDDVQNDNDVVRELNEALRTAKTY